MPKFETLIEIYRGSLIIKSWPRILYIRSIGSALFNPLGFITIKELLSFFADTIGPGV